MIAALLLQFQAALDAAAPGATLRADDYRPVIKRDILVTKPVTIIGGIFAGTDWPERHLLPEGREREFEEPCLRIFDQGVDHGTVTFQGSAIFGNVQLRFDELVLDRCLVYGTIRAFPGTKRVRATLTSIRADTDKPRAAAAISAPGCEVILAAALAKGGSPAPGTPCRPADGGAGVVCAVLTTSSGARARGGPGACGGLRGPDVEILP